MKTPNSDKSKIDLSLSITEAEALLKAARLGIEDAISADQIGETILSIKDAEKAIFKLSNKISRLQEYALQQSFKK